MSSWEAQFKASTEKFSKLLKKRCFRDGCKGKTLYIWDQRDFFAPPTMKNAQACITICSLCIAKKMLTNPPVLPVPRFVRSDLLEGTGEKEGKLPIEKEDLFSYMNKRQLANLKP